MLSRGMLFRQTDDWIRLAADRSLSQAELLRQIVNCLAGSDGITESDLRTALTQFFRKYSVYRVFFVPLFTTTFATKKLCGILKSSNQSIRATKVVV